VEQHILLSELSWSSSVSIVTGDMLNNQQSSLFTAVCTSSQTCTGISCRRAADHSWSSAAVVFNLGYADIEKRKYYFMINTEKSGPDLLLPTGDLDVKTFDLGAPFLCPPPMRFLSGQLVSFYSTWCIGTCLILESLFSHLKLILDVIHLIYFICRLYTMYNLNYAPTALGVQS
jgi:hypothetical protein